MAERISIVKPEKTFPDQMKEKEITISIKDLNDLLINTMNVFTPLLRPGFDGCGGHVKVPVKNPPPRWDGRQVIVSESELASELALGSRVVARLDSGKIVIEQSVALEDQIAIFAQTAITNFIATKT